MPQAMQILLSDQAASSVWGESAKISSSANSITIHTADEGLMGIQTAGRSISEMGVRLVALTGDGWTLENQWHFHQGFVSPKHPEGIEYAPLDESETAILESRINSFNWVKYLINATPQDLAPMDLVQQVADHITELAAEATSYEILSGDELLAKGYTGIHAVGRGSDRPPALLTLDYNPSGDDDAPVEIALVGKGITFDSGGYSLKGNDGMLYMKIDMGGAATVSGALSLAIQNGLNKRVRLILCCAENLINGCAYKLGDILKYRNGVTVEIANTDAEGRLVLADGLIDASATGAKTIIDAATLTGAAVVAVGTNYNAVMSMDDDLTTEFLKMSTAENEMHWPLPLDTSHANSCPSDFADTRNSKPVKGGGAAGASNAAGFLSRFVAESKGWLHIDLSAVSCDSATKHYAAGATGQGVRTIARLLLD